MVGNHTNVKSFVDLLKPFWKDLLSGVKGGPCDFEHIVVFYEEEQSEQAKCFEIYFEEHMICELINGTLQIKPKQELIIKHHELPFCWNQF